MNNGNQNHTGLVVYRRLMMVLFGFGILLAGGCESPSDSDGQVINGIALPTDVVLNLACENVGINDVEDAAEVWQPGKTDAKVRNDRIRQSGFKEQG